MTRINAPERMCAEKEFTRSLICKFSRFPGDTLKKFSRMSENKAQTFSLIIDPGRSKSHQLKKTNLTKITT